MKLINGKKIATRILADLKKKIAKTKRKPKLAVILVGNDAASRLYVSLKEQKAREAGIDLKKYELPASTEEKKVLELVEGLNDDKATDGILVQLPLPSFFKTDRITNSIKQEKDVDGFGDKNRQDVLAARSPILPPVLPSALKEILKANKIKLKGKKVAAVVNSEIFGKILCSILEKEGARAEYLVKKVCLDKGLEDFLGEADIVISVTGCPGLIKGNMVKKGVVLLDAGIFWQGKKVVGDVDIESVKERAAWLTPTPGGVGPVTVATLLKNVYLASKLKK